MELGNSRVFKERRVGLPYANNLPVILITVITNLAAAFLFHFRSGVTLTGFISDAAICGMTMALCDGLYVYYAIQKMRKDGQLPRTVPQSAFMQRLPKSIAGCIVIFAAAFGVIMALFSAAVVWFFDIQIFTFPRFLVWKLVYSLILSAKVIELTILRFVQPDCIKAGDPLQTGTDLVKNPLPRRDTFVHLFNTVVEDFGFNMVMGLLSGGAFVDAASKCVIIAPTTRSGIVLGGLILGLVITLRMVYPVAKQINAVKASGALPPMERRSWCMTWLPEKPAFFALALTLPTMVLSAAVLWAALTFFGFETLHFFQFFIVRTIYATLLSKLVTMLAILRYRQPGAAQRAVAL